MNRCLLVLLALLCTSCVYAQAPLYTMLSAEPLPAWVNTSPATYKAEITAKRKATGLAYDAVTTPQAMEQANAAQYSYLYSGRLLFNDDAGKLVERLTDVILKDKPAERAMIHPYVHYTAGTDAVVLPNGLIVIELGLIAQLENENQLAFALCHEFAHFLQGDVATGEAPAFPQYGSREEEQYLEYLRSREREADILAINLYQKAGFLIEDALRYFEVRSADQPVAHAIPFDMNFFGNSQWQFPGHFNFSATLPDTLAETDFRKSSAYSFDDRRNYLIEYFGLKVTLSPSVAGKDFQSVNRLAAYNCGLLALESHNYAAAVYIGYYLHKTDSSARKEVDMLIAKALYCLTASEGLKVEDADLPVGYEVYREEKFYDLFSFYTEPPPPLPDTRGYIIQAELFLNHFEIQDMAALCIDWCWSIVLNRTKDQALALELCERSVSIFNLYDRIPVDSLARYRVPGERTIGEHKQNKYKPQKGGKKNEFNSPLGDEFEKLMKEKMKKYDTIGKKPLYVNAQLAHFLNDTGFRQMYKTSQEFDARFDLMSKQNKMLPTDTICLLGSNQYWLKEYKRTTVFEVDEAVSETRSVLHLKNIKTIAPQYKVQLLDPDPAGTGLLTVTAYNTFSLASRTFSEITFDEANYCAKPLAYANTVAPDSHVEICRYALTDYSLTRYWSSLPHFFTYRQSTVYDLELGIMKQSWVWAGKGQSTLAESKVYYYRVFHYLQQGDK